LAEALACGLVPVVSDVGCVRELIDEKGAKIVPSQAEDMARGILELTSSAQTFSGMSEYGRRKVLTIRGPQWFNDELDRLQYGDR
jgi:glycosyltransferase involved in cell wall biosynthesis